MNPSNLKSWGGGKSLICGLLALVACGTSFLTPSAQAASFTAGDLAVVRAAASANNTTASVIEISATTANQTANAVQRIDIPGTGASSILVSGSATSTLYAADSNDGSLFCFTGANSTGTANVNTLNPRAVVTLNNAGTITLQTTYTGTSGNQTRCASSLDNSTWYVSDQGGIYTNSAIAASPSGNTRGIKAFGGTVYTGQQSGTAANIQVSTVSAATGGTIVGLPGLTNNSAFQDFYLISSGSNGSAFDILYVLSSTTATAGTINKYSLVSGSWSSNGSYTTTFGGFGLAAARNGSGANLYATTGTGATTANNVVKLTDTAGYSAAISITTSSNVTLYTAPSGTIIKGIAFSPVSSATITGAATATAFTTTYGTASAAQTFSVSGSSLTANIIATAPTGFEVSSDGTTYGSTATFTQSGGTASGSLRLRFAATAAVTGSYNGVNIPLTSTGATTVNITTAASGNTVSAEPLTITASDVTKQYGNTLNGPVTGSTAFTSSGLVGADTIGSVTITYGSGAAAGDAAGSYPGSVTPSAATDGNFTASNYSISYVSGNITVTAAPTITLTGTLSAVNTTYGTASPTTGFSVTGLALSGDLTVSAPAGFEVSSGGAYSTSLSLPQSAGAVSASVNVRLAATTTVGTYSGNVSVSGGGATSQNIAVPSSTVSTLGLTITGVSGVSKPYDRTTTANVTGTPTLVGVLAGDSGNVTVSGTPAATFATATAGTSKSITVTGYSLAGSAASNYTVTQPTGVSANITQLALTVSGAAVTSKSYNGNTRAIITGTLVGVISPDVVTFNGVGTFASSAVGTNIAVTSTSTLGGADAANYSLTQPTGLVGTITTPTPVTSAGNLIVSRSVYTGTGATVPYPGTLPNGASSVTDGTYPTVWGNEAPDVSFGVTSPIYLDQITPSGTLVSTVALTSAVSDQLGLDVSTSFPSKSELALNLTPDSTGLTFMCYLARANMLDVSNTDTPGHIDPTNPVTGTTYQRAIVQADCFGNVQVTPVNSYSGNNGRAAVLAGGNYFTVGNAGNGSGDGTILSLLSDDTGVQMIAPGVGGTAQAVGTTFGTNGSSSGYQHGFSVANVGFSPGKTGKDMNLRGLTINPFTNTLFVSKGSGGNGINTVYQVGPGGVPTTANATSLTFTIPPGFSKTSAKSGLDASGANQTIYYPFGMWFGDANTMYVADEGNPTSIPTTYDSATGKFTSALPANNPTAGLQKWVFDGTKWNLAYTLINGLNLGQPFTVAGYPTGNNPATSLPWSPANSGLRNITGKINGDGTVTIYAVTSTQSGGTDQGADPNQLVVITDTLATTTLPATESFTVIKTAGNKEVLRGVSLAPHGTPDLAIAASHVGSFSQSDVADTVNLTINNVGTDITSGTVTVTDTLPTGLTPTEVNVGTINGWTVSTSGQAVTATRSDALAAGSTYPVLPITVRVSRTAASSLSNTASVAGGGETNLANDTSTDTIAIATVVTTPLESWSQTYFGTTDTSGDYANDASYSHDGVANLVKYALGVDPTSSGSTGVAALPTKVLNDADPLLSDRLALSFVLQSPNPSDITYLVEATGDLVNWTPVASKAGTGAWTWLAGGTPHIVISGNGPVTVKIGDAVPASGNPARMMRLKVK